MSKESKRWKQWVLVSKEKNVSATLTKVKEWLQNEIENTELNDEKLCESNDDFIHYGRQECADGLLTQIKKWEEEHGI